MFSESRAFFKFISNKKKSDGYSTKMRNNAQQLAQLIAILMIYVMGVLFHMKNTIYTKLKTLSEDMTFGPLPPIVLLKCVRASLHPFPNFLTNP